MSARSLRESNRIGWIHAIVFYATGVQQLRETRRVGWFYAIVFCATRVWQLRETSRIGWFYATAACGVDVDKADFHATGPNKWELTTNHS